MSASRIAHLAIFTAGAAVGAGLTYTVAWARPKRSSAASAPAPNARIGLPILEAEVGATGSPGIVRIQSIPGDILKYGNPGPISDLLQRKVYVAGYDRRLRHPAWTAEHLTLAGLYGGDNKGDRSKSTFHEDLTIPQQFRATLHDYFRSGYDRGHMVPAADAKSSQDAMDETFLLSNMAPQVGAGFNRHYWAYVEDWCRRLTTTFADVYVFTIPLYLPKQDTDGKWRVTHEVIGAPPNVSVPTHFAKVILASRPVSSSTPLELEVSTGAFVMPNAPIPDDTPLQTFLLPVDAVERAAGLSLFSEAIKQQARDICKTTSCDILIRRFNEEVTRAKGPSR